MFDRIGMAREEGDRKRQMTSAVLTTLMCGAAVGFWMGVAAWQLGSEQLPEMQPMEFVQLVEEPLPDHLDDPLPKVPERKMIAKGTDEPDPATPEPPPDPDVTPDTLPPPDDAMKSNKGHADGTDVGDPEGDLTGTNTGSKNGTGTGGGDGTAHHVHNTELSWKKRPTPDWPAAATNAGIQEARCMADVTFGDDGMPATIHVRGCPKVFHGSVREAFERSRVWPFKSKGRKVSVSTTLLIRYVLKE